MKKDITQSLGVVLRRFFLRREETFSMKSSVVRYVDLGTLRKKLQKIIIISFVEIYG